MTRPPRSTSPSWPGAALLVLLTVLAFVPAMRAGYIWDDDAYVTGNRTLRTLQGLQQIWLEPGAVPQYYPLVHTSFWLEFHAWGLSPAGYHVINVLLHAAAALLLWRVLLRLAVPGAWLAAAIFAVHPVMVESVAWITERKNVLSAVFYLAATLAWLRWEDARDAGTARPRSWWAALAFFVAALLSKTVTCTLPAALLIVRWWRKGSLRWRDVTPLLPFFAVGAGLGMVTAWLEAHHVGAQGAEWNLSFAERCLIAGRALWFYAGKIVWPWPLTFIYPRWDLDAGAWWQWLFPAAAAGLLLALWLARARLGRGALAAALFFGATLGPALGFINVYPMRYSFVADHFQYLAALGPIVLLAAALCRLPRAAATAATALLPLALAALTWRHATEFRDAETLWRATLRDNPSCWMAYGNLGAEVQRRGQFDEAIDLYRRGIELHPDYGLAHTRWGDALMSKGRYDDAVAQFSEAIRLEPELANSYNLRGRAFMQLKRYPEAIEDFRRAAERNPAYVEPHLNWGAALAFLHDDVAALAQFDEAVRIDPSFLPAYFARGNFHGARGRAAEAVRDYRMADMLDPEHPGTSRKMIVLLTRQLALQGRTTDAESVLDDLLREQPNDTDAQQALQDIRAKKP